MKQIQIIVQNYLEAKKLTEAIVGTIEKVNPLLVRVDSKLTIDEDFIHVPSSIKINNNDVGKKLLLLRVQSGQLFIVLDKF